MIRRLHVGPTIPTRTRLVPRSHQPLRATRTRAQQHPTTHQPQSVAALEVREAIRTIAPSRLAAVQADTRTLPRDRDRVEVAITLSMFKV